jgi:predicted DNA-binding transcriptional regulator YafY
MNRVERLTAILTLLQDRPRNSVEIARHSEGSKRTIQRDVQALCEMGVPVTPAHDAGGWVEQDGDYKLVPPSLTVQEALLMLLAARAIGRLTGALWPGQRLAGRQSARRSAGRPDGGC